MVFIDTHVHLYDEKYQEDVSSVIQAAGSAGVSKFFLPNVSLTTIVPMLSIIEKHRETCYPMLGLHPCEITGDYQQMLDKLAPWFSHYAFAGIGEVGLDFYWDKTYYKEQLAAFQIFIDWALHYDLPLIIHARKAIDEVIKILKDRNNESLRGIFHCFTGTTAQAKQVISLGFALGIGGIVTFAKSPLVDVLSNIALEHLVLETDGPYLAPVPHRGKRNEPAYIPLVANKIATIKQVDLEEVARKTTQRSLDIFGS